jgi:hypothetical protein
MTRDEYERRLQDLAQAGLWQAHAALREWWAFWHGRAA